MTDWLPYVLLIVCGVVFVALGGWYRRQKKAQYLAEVGQVLGYPVTEWTESCCDDSSGPARPYHPLGSNNFCYCDCNGGGGGRGCGGGGGGGGGDREAACILLLVFAILLSVAACLAWCPVEPHFQVEDRKKKQKHVVYNTDSAYIYHGERFKTLEKLRDRLKEEFGEEEEKEGETAVVPVIKGEEVEGEASVLPWQNEREEGSVPLKQVMTV